MIVLFDNNFELNLLYGYILCGKFFNWEIGYYNLGEFNGYYFFCELFFYEEWFIVFKFRCF